MKAEDRPSTPTERTRPAAAVIGVGAVTAFGWSVDDLRAGLRSGRRGVQRAHQLDVSGHRTELASEVEDRGLGAGEHAAAAGSSRQARADGFAVAASREAWDMAFGARGETDSGASSPPSMERVGVFYGGSTAGMAESEEFFARVLGTAEGASHLRLLESQQLNGPGDAVARDLGACGPVESLSSACASGALALGAALDALRSGEIDVAVAGGSDALCQLTYAGFNSLRAVDPRPSRPFRADREGLNLGEGAGTLVLVRADHPRLRERAPLAWLVGYGASCDAHHMTAPHPEGRGAEQAMRMALGDGGASASSVGFANAHGTGTPHNDSAEAAALARVVGPHAVPVTSNKGAIGHLLGSAGAVEAVATVLALVDAEVQPTCADDPEPGADADLVTDLVLGTPRPLEAGRDIGLSSSFAFGGANGCLAFRAARATDTGPRAGGSQ